MRFLFTALGLLTGLTLQAQTITLDACYDAARANYPLLKQKGIIQQSADLAVASLQTNRRLPQLAVNGQATWQSEVTKLPIELPNFQVPGISKDQYKLTLDASYTLYDGQLTQRQVAVQQATAASAQQQVEVELNRLKEQVNGLFLNALLADETIRINQAVMTDLQNRIGKVKAGVTFGTAAQMNADALQAEYLRADQRMADLTASRRGFRETLGLLTGLPVTDSTRLTVTPLPQAGALVVTRPELQLFKNQRLAYDAQEGLLDNRLKPRLSLFAQGGAGRPALNFLNNDFRGFFIGGLRLNWTISQAYTLRNDRQALALNRQAVDVQQAVFEKNLSVQLRQQQTEIDRIEAQIVKDADLVALRAKVRQAASVQLDNGVIAARDYTTELNNEVQALLNQKLHALQLLMARITYKTLTGN
ncbi:TolC family protein [Arsenicibacter rosenii]|uniref:Transporter n=1 Tax=Arsenicibacter rosenii TaxID=1750698 RepID=A0A1S2VG34_9BACT|nr:TolC family protein [Arsenicibacter rosenii]OIN57380.1 transporter [Arsenicibacter rosenii]